MNKIYYTSNVSIARVSDWEVIDIEEAKHCLKKFDDSPNIMSLERSDGFLGLMISHEEYDIFPGLFIPIDMLKDFDVTIR